MNASFTKGSIIIFAYAPVGFGHLRVTDSLYHGLPQEITPILLGSQDQSISTLYRFISIHPITRMLMEWSQRGIGEKVFTFFYKAYLRSHAKLLYQQLITILEQRIDIPDTIFIIATHFGLAHQLSLIKEKLQKERNIRIILVVQITDDSPQNLWYIPGADITFAPSEKTARILVHYGKKTHLPAIPIIVNPYPVSPVFTERLSEEAYIKRTQQVDPQSHAKTHIVIPISGAAVGTSFYSKLIAVMGKNNRFVFHVVAKSAPYTQVFLQTILAWSSIDLHVSFADREVVNMYEYLYVHTNMSLEITKPSEQAFKAILNPRRRGGVLLLFTEPVGRQEIDNLDFLSRHGLLPLHHEQSLLWKAAEKGREVDETLYHKSQEWRGLILPKDPEKAANFINWIINQNIAFQMMHKKEGDVNNTEVSPYGVSLFWKKVEEFMKTHK